MRVLHTRFTVTAGAIVLDSEKRVLLFEHRFRGGSGWGIPGGFIEAREQPADAVKRELREEVGLEIEVIKTLTTRSFERVKQIEILFLCKPTNGTIEPRSAEIKQADWFRLSELPAGLPRDQKRILTSILGDGANLSD